MITSKQRAYLRSLANSLTPIGQIGKDGITQSVIESVEKALKAREIVKLTVLETALLSAREASDALCEALSAEGVQCIGNRLVIYKRNDEKPQITLPK